MKQLSIFFDKGWKINLLLIGCSFTIYFFYLNRLFLNLNSVLSTITLDALKNYYTFIFHVKYDPGLLHFEGMNYPFGEHVVYTDCQPLFTFILRLLPFTHNYLVGIIHSLLLLSFICTPVIINNIFRRLGVGRFLAFFASLGIAVLSPQFWRIDGHFALSYTCVIPLLILLLLKLANEQKKSTLLLLFFYNTALFLVHPYLGFGASVFSFIAIALFSLRAVKTQLLKNLLAAVCTGLLPVILFKAFMLLSDLHQNRTNEPQGGDVLTATLAGTLVPGFGPFNELLKTLISAETPNFESLCYIGIFSELMVIIALALLPLGYRKMKPTREISSLFITALLLLLFAFGLHNKIAALLHTEVRFLSQFRALGRFGWFFYYLLPIFLVTLLDQYLKKISAKKTRNAFIRILAILFFTFNLLEAHSMFKYYTAFLYHDRNFFSARFLNAEEKQMLQSLQANKPQAIITLPVFYVGSEIYDRLGSSPEMIPAMLYSSHTGLPIAGVFMSRTSITETEAGIELLNDYKKNRPVFRSMTDAPLFVISTKNPRLPDEERTLAKTRIFHRNDSLAFGYISRQALAEPALRPYIHQIKSNRQNNEDDIIFIHTQNKTPYLPARLSNFEMACELDSNKIKTGSYIASFHYYYDQKNCRGISASFIVTKTHQKEYVWEHSMSLRNMSGFYNGFGVFEYRVELDRHNKYEFLIKGELNQQYHIADFMLRPDTSDVEVAYPRGDTSINNFPTR